MTRRLAKLWQTSQDLQHRMGGGMPSLESFFNQPWALEPSQFHGIVAAYAANQPGRLRSLEGQQLQDPVIADGVAILPLIGMLAPAMPWYVYGTSTERFGMELLAAIDNPDVRQIVIRINSPGGSVFGMAELSDLIYSNRGKKPITAYCVNGAMASAAYGIGSACDHVYSTASGMIGSIGTMYAHYDFSKAEADFGLKVTVLSRPDAKRVGNSHEPLTDEARAQLLAELVDPYYEQFVALVARNRGIDPQQVIDTYGGGAVMIAGQARAAGMVDNVVDWNEFLAGLSAGNPRNHFAGSRPAPPTQESPPMKYSVETMAVLYAFGLIASLQATAEETSAAVRGWCAARGVAVPTEEAELVKLVQGSRAPSGQAQSPPSPPAAPPAATEIRQHIVAERQRVSAIRQRAKLLELQADAAEVNAAIDNGTTPEAFAEAVMSAAIAANRPLVPRADASGRIAASEASLDKFAEAAVDALLLRSQSSLEMVGQSYGSTPAQSREAVTNLVRDNQTVREIMQMPFRDIARQCVELSGITVRDRSAIGYAEAFLSLTGQTKHPFATGHPRIMGGAGTMAFNEALQGPGDYPRIMDGVASKIVMFAAQMAPVSYPAWCRRISDQDNFQPKEIITFGQFGELPLHVDGKRYGQSDLPNEAAWLLKDEYGDEFVLTPRMVLQDPMDYLIIGLTSKQVAHERTLNRLCVNLLTGNVASPTTGNPTYSHNNNIEGEGGPSIESLKSMRKLLNQQTMVGGTEEAGLDLAVILTGSEWLTDAQVVTWNVPGQSYQPATLANVNPWTYLQPVYDPMISGASADGKTWYGAASPALLPGVVFGFVAGYGPGGRRLAYWDPSTGCMHYQFQGAFGAALLHHEALVRSDGQVVAYDES